MTTLYFSMIDLQLVNFSQIQKGGEMHDGEYEMKNHKTVKTKNWEETWKKNEPVRRNGGDKEKKTIILFPGWASIFYLRVITHHSFTACGIGKVFSCIFIAIIIIIIISVFSYIHKYFFLLLMP